MVYATNPIILLKYGGLVGNIPGKASIKIIFNVATTH